MSDAPVQTHALDYRAILQNTTSRTDAFLRDFIASRDGVPALLRESIEYSLFGPGKRVRPALAILSAQAVGGTPEAALPAAAALELIHCFSLVHDDLPSMDNDDLRRGRPTNHKVYGDAVAILAGDAMNTLAFELLAESLSDPALAVKLSLELARATGPAGMIGGQILDTCYPQLKHVDSQAADLASLQRIHRLKTGALIRAACRMGGISAQADSWHLQILDELGQAVGLVFQIVDDLLDVTSSDAHLGKKTGKDADIGKLTYPVLLGVEKTNAELNRQQKLAEQALARLGPAAEPLSLVVHALARRDK
jgi:geranylgeranyl diphosphate synthase type II